MKKLLVINLAVLMMSSACRPDKFEDIGVKENRIQQIPGSYKLTRVIQSDVRAVNNNYPYKTLDQTNSFPFTEFELTLSVNGNAPTEFTTVTGNSPEVIPFQTGKWAVNNTDAPTWIYFIKGDDTTKLQFGTYKNLKDGKLSLRKTEYLDGKAVTYYDYEFSKK